MAIPLHLEEEVAIPLHLKEEMAIPLHLEAIHLHSKEEVVVLARDLSCMSCRELLILPNLLYFKGSPLHS